MDDLSFLEELVAIPSISGEEDAFARHLVARMGGLGFRARRDAAGNVIGEVGDPQAARTMVLLGHMDTVPGAIPVRREGGFLYGRGAVDAKGPLAAFVLAAARAAPQLGGTRVVVIGAVEEETRSRGAHHLARTMAPPDHAVIGEPSGWQGITLGYKGALCVNYRLVRPAGHGAGDRSTPAEEAVAFWNRLVRHAAKRNGEHRPPRFDTLDATLQSVGTSGDGLEDWVEMDIAVRLPLGIDVAALQRTMREWRDGAELTFPYSEPPFRAGKNTPVVRALLQAIRAAGGRPRFKLKTGTSDMNVVGPAWGCPIVAYGPGDSLLDHTPDERIDVAEFRRGVAVLADALQSLMP
ncbi:MAG: [LysW]-lysine hydrolase [Anaerolineae bacterium]|jgi:LysW-gamma-L-lysine carboxypeptidase